MLTVTPSSISVAAVVGNTGSQTVTATNVGNSSVAIKQVTVTGAGFSTTGLAVPASVAPGASQSFQVAFAATTPGTATGSMSIMTNAGSSPVVVVQLSATATATPSAPAPPPTPPPAPTPPATVTSVTISPASASVSTKGTISFTSTVQGTTTNSSVTWTASSGTISSAGLYTAPEAAGSATITAISVADTTKSASATVTITGAPVANPVVSSVTVSPASASVSTSGTAQFAAIVEGTVTNKSVTWKASAGAISSAGLYTAPATAGSATVTATSVADTTKSASASVTISAPAPAPPPPPVVNSVSVTPSSATVTTDNINIPAGPDTGTVNVEIANGNNYNIILDHITTRWAGNKLWITLSNYIGPNRLITTQWSMFYEPNVNHPVGPGTSTNTGCTASGGSPCFSSGEHDIDFHHNLFADMSHRIPESTNYSTRWVNNIVFNWNFYASEWLGAMSVDEIGNKYVAGNLNSGSQKHEIHFTTLSPPLPGHPSTYPSGNIGPNQSDPSGNQYAMAAEIDGENGDEIGAVPSSWIRSSPMPAPAFPINADPVGNLDSVLLHRRQLAAPRLQRQLGQPSRRR